MALAIPALAGEGVSSGPAASPTLTEISSFDDRTQPSVRTILNPGGLKMFVYVPESVRASSQPRPLVVALHGCAMTAEDYFVATGWAQLAEKWSFALLLPQQEKPTTVFDFVTGKNNTAVCFSWWEADRGNAEVRSIMNMIRILFEEHKTSLDPRRIYVTGVSAGAAMTVDLLALYPTCFAGGAPIAGIAFSCSQGSVNQAIFDCMQPTKAPGLRPRKSVEEGGRKDFSAQQWGDWVRRVCRDNRDCPSSERGWPRIAIWQGAQDRMVGPGNMRDLRRQWTNIHGINEVVDHRDTREVSPYVVDHKKYADKRGRVLVETWLVGKEGPATDHGVVIDPDLKEEKFVCGRTQDFVYDGNVCSTLEIARFFKLEDMLEQPAEAGGEGGRCAALQ
jgi:poly(hydroxyalkanoate) depolymerase family esterase